MAYVSSLPDPTMLTASVTRETSPGPLPARQRMESRLTGVVARPPRGRCTRPALLCAYTGEGTLSHVGSVRFHSTHCVYATAGGRPNGHFGEAEMVMVTPGGEEIYATYTGQRFAESKYLVFIRVTGGSGKYSEMTGSLVAIATLDPATSDVFIRGWGWTTG